MAKVYRDCGYELAVLPKAGLAARAEFILNCTRAAD
jgi:predicted ATPase